MSRYRKRPFEVEAVQWTGDNLPTLERFTGGEFAEIPEPDREDPCHNAEVFDKLHNTWISLKTGDWILKGIDGEFYPCEESVFALTYEAAEVNPTSSMSPSYIYVAVDDRGDLRAAFTDKADIKPWAQRAQEDDEDLTGWTLYRMVDNPCRGHRPQPRNLTAIL